MKLERIIFIMVLGFSINYTYYAIAGCFGCNCNGWYSWNNDSAGTRQACVSGLPTTNERMQFIRMNTNPFVTIYSVQYQYCWFCFFGDCVLAGDVQTVNFNNGDLFSWKIGGIFGGHAKHINGVDKVALVEYPPSAFALSSSGSASYAQGGVDNTTRNIVCAYYCEGSLNDSDCSPGSWSWQDSLIGCVEAPMLPGPPSYNNVMVAGTSAVVDNITTTQGYVALGSTLDQPLIRLNQLSPIDAIEAQLILRYVFPGDISNDTGYPTCGGFAGATTQYCAQVSSANPSQVCACEQSQCANEEYLGCVDIPTATQSNYATIANFVTYIDQNGNSYPALNYMFVRKTAGGQVIYLDANNAQAIQAADGNQYLINSSGEMTGSLAHQPTRYDTLPFTPQLPSTYQEPASPPPTTTTSGAPIAIPVRDYYISTTSVSTSSGMITTQALMQDASPVTYGVQFQAVIPEFQSNGQFYQVNLQSIAPVQNLPGCVVYSSIPSTATPAYIVPTGIRYRNLCCPPSAGSNNDYANCVTPPVSCTGSTAYIQDCVADFSLCPGVYGGPTTPGTPDQMCLVAAGSWDFIGANAPICVTIPNNFQFTTVSGGTSTCIINSSSGV